MKVNFYAALFSIAALFAQTTDAINTQMMAHGEDYADQHELFFAQTEEDDWIDDDNEFAQTDQPSWNQKRALIIHGREKKKGQKEVARHSTEVKKRQQQLNKTRGYWPRRHKMNDRNNWQRGQNRWQNHVNHHNHHQQRITNNIQRQKEMKAARTKHKNDQRLQNQKAGKQREAINIANRKTQRDTQVRRAKQKGVDDVAEVNKNVAVDTTADNSAIQQTDAKIKHQQQKNKNIVKINKQNEDLQAVKNQTKEIEKAAADKLAKQKEAARIARLAKQNPKKAAKKMEEANQVKKAKAGKQAEPTKEQKRVKTLNAKNAKLVTQNSHLKSENQRLKKDIQEMEEAHIAGIQMAADEIAVAHGKTPEPLITQPSNESAEKNAQAEVAQAKAEQTVAETAAKTA